MTTVSRYRLPRRMTREAWHEHRALGFVRWVVPRSLFASAVIGVPGLFARQWSANDFAFPAGWFMQFVTDYLVYLPMYLFVAVACFSLLWLHYEEAFFHKPANGSDGG